MSATTQLPDATWLSEPGLRRVLDLLNAQGEEARVVGGAVRDALIGRPVREKDIATTAQPDEVMRRAKAAGIKAVPTGLAHGTVTLVVGGEAFEVTTLREDVETFGRKATVAFGRDWTRDAQRRDFTINGLSVDADGRVYDEVGGLDDIAARRVRFIGDPDTRIAEDYLRILRFFRFHASFGEGPPDRDALLACARGRLGLGSLSAERLRMEMLKLLVAKGALDAVRAMDDAGLLVAITGGVTYTRVLATLIDREAQLNIAADPMRRLAALCVAVTEDAKRLAIRLRLTNAEAKALDSMGHRWWRLASMDAITAKRRLYRLGAARYRDRILLAWARAGSAANPETWRERVTLPERWTAPVFPLKAADFIARGMVAGPGLGHVLTLAEDAWLAADFPMERSALEAIADATIARFRHDHRL
jgi:poly(A) polymerase